MKRNDTIISKCGYDYIYQIDEGNKNPPFMNKDLVQNISELWYFVYGNS